MKLKLFLIFLVLLVSIASASNLETLQQEYNTGETVQAYYTGTLKTENIYLLDSDSQDISISPLLINYKDDNYFFYFNLPSDLTEGEYKVIANSEKSNITLTTNSAITIKPAFVTLNDDTFIITIENIAQESITTEISTNNQSIKPRKTILSFESEEEKNLYVDYDNMQTSAELYITYNSKTYTIPLYNPNEIIIENITEEINITNETTDTIENITQEPVTIVENVTEEDIEPIKFLTTKETQDYKIYTDQSLSGQLPIKNNQEERIEVTITTDENISQIIRFSETQFFVEPGEYTSVTMSINDDQAEPGIYQGNIYATSEENIIELLFTVEVIEEETIDNDEPTIEWPTQYEYEEEESSISAPVVIGIVLSIILLALLIVIYLKIKPPETKDYNKVIKERAK
jgi:hypothetical protein